MEVKIFGEWIRRHLPSSIPDEMINDALMMGGYYQKGMTVMAYGERGGPDELIYKAESGHDLCLWQFDRVCYRIAGSLEFAHRKENSRKWRYLRDHAENGRWMYIERRDYFYNAIEDTRLAAFEVYLRLLKPVFSSERWESKVREYTGLLNRWYKRDHWDFDRKKLCFVEISCSREYASDFDDTEEPQPEQIIKVI